MLLKKINSGLSLLTVLVLLAHISISFQLLIGRDIPIREEISLITIILVITHGILSMAVVAFIHEGNDMKYPKKNISTIVQRISGILLLIPLFLSHNTGAYAPGKATFYGFIEILFFLLVSAHIATSVHKAFITLGIVKSEKAVKIIRIIFTILAIAITVAGSVMAVKTIIIKP